ncbi:hypothetical protein KC323_g4171 [Hortaea werneckii]|uniref:Uncharacterized protein n=2 Tax=Hortaea werneckii TaxID=91943 RepID=A0A3M7H7W1_HORWE|nr:hypothetical protein KC323_g4171 [Hortaea werneckii]RMZ09394.1 hypothetical protein D0862_03604 [Hortaea werneckii]
MVALGQTVTIVNQSGKVVKTSKHLVNVWKEAKGAYSERKAELKAVRDDEQNRKIAELKVQKQLEQLQVDDDAQSRASSRRSSRSRSGEKKIARKPLPNQGPKPPMERGFSDSFYANDRPERSKPSRPSPLRNDSHDSRSSFRDYEPRIGELQRRHTTDMRRIDRRPATPTRSASADEIDMDLAYGEMPPPLPEKTYDDQIELRTKMTALQRLLDECNCLQHTATATIDNLQKNPEAMAAVALTLAEISNLATKLAPGALASLKTSFPAIVALLASPQFAIAAGVGVGVTVIAFGSYKIIKRIQAKKEEKKTLENGMTYGPAEALPEPESPASSDGELRELNRIERWRRGVSDAEAESLGTSVTGEFITPHAARSMIEDGKLTEADFKPREAKSKKGAKSEKGDKEKKKKHHHHRSDRSETGSRVSSRSGRSKANTERPKKKEPSGLRMLFKTHA